MLRFSLMYANNLNHISKTVQLKAKVMKILDDVNQIQVLYDKNDVRKVRCFCGEVCKISILPHLRRSHPEKWEKWRLDFVRLRNKGWSYKRIMWKYRAIFTWTVIEREIRKIIEEGKASLVAREKGKIVKWNPTDPSLERATVWDFPRRGSWATHTSEYRGNWPPKLPRNLILKYTKRGDLVFAPFVGGGTTLIEAYLLGRKSVGLDINPVAIKMSEERIDEMKKKIRQSERGTEKRYTPLIILGDARNSVRTLMEMGFDRASIDLICTHPPYLDAIKYTEKVKGDLSHIKDEEIFCNEIEKVAVQLHTLLKVDGICAVLIGDTRRSGKLIPLGFKVMERFLKDSKFEIEEIIIKTQHQDKSTEFYRNKFSKNYLLSHEYLFVFSKLKVGVKSAY